MIIFCLLSLLALVAFAMYMTFKEQREVEEYCHQLSTTGSQSPKGSIPLHASIKSRDV
jgi:hypothetical protein